MFSLNMNEIIMATEGKLLGEGRCDLVSGVSTDSRKIQSGDLFIPLKGDKFDGHDYISNSFEQGAAVALTQREDLHYPGKSLILVKDTMTAMQKLATYYRSSFSIPFVGITGSVGKTSTKEMIACAIGTKYKVLNNEGNYNNEIGVPQTIFRLDKSHEAAVIEMGMSGFGEMSILTSIVRPDVAIITNIGISHIEKLGSRQNILRAKMEILEGLQPGGLVVLNGDDALLSGVKGLLTKRTVSYGLEEGVNYQAYNVRSYGENGIDFDVTVEGKDYTIHVPAPGTHNVYNALAAVAAGHELGIPTDELAKGILKYSPSKMRLNIIKENNLTVINDTYNSSPQSVKAALDVMEELEADRRIAVLGDMLELGEWSVQSHLETGRQAADKKLDYIVAVGSSASFIAEGAIAAGFASERVAAFQSNAEAVEYLQKILQSGDAILVKGSRGMKMEEIVQALINEY